jgi:hypothetical protein
MIEYFRLNIEYLRSASGGSILKRAIKKKTERSDFHKYSIVNLQSSIPACPDPFHQRITHCDRTDGLVFILCDVRGMDAGFEHPGNSLLYGPGGIFKSEAVS